MSDQKTSFWMSPRGLAAMGLVASVSYFLFMEHRQHLVQYLPFIIILILCPLMHVFMHGKHGHEGNDKHEKPSENTRDSNSKLRDTNRDINEDRK